VLLTKQPARLSAAASILGEIEHARRQSNTDAIKHQKLRLLTAMFWNIFDAQTRSERGELLRN